MLPHCCRKPHDCGICQGVPGRAEIWLCVCNPFRDPKMLCRIRFHSPATSAALWSGEKGRIDCGMAIIDTVPDEKYKDMWRPIL